MKENVWLVLFCVLLAAAALGALMLVVARNYYDSLTDEQRKNVEDKRKQNIDDDYDNQLYI